MTQAIPYQRITFKECPFVFPCNHCIEKTCTSTKVCQKLWDFLAARGDWVSKQNRELEEKYGVNSEIQIMLDCKRKNGVDGCKGCTNRVCYVGNKTLCFSGKPT
jgi:hypothetical protein